MIKITQGQIHINSISLYTLGGHNYMAEMDCRAKYPEILGVSRREIYLHKGEHTLHAEGCEESTVVFFDVDAEIVACESSRYTVHVLLIKREELKPPFEWWDDK